MVPGPKGCNVFSAQATEVHIINCVVLVSISWSIVAARTVGLEAGPPGSVAKDKARQQWWLEIVACTHLAVGPNCRCPCGGRGQVQTCLKRWAGTNYRLTGHCSVPECQCAFLLLQALPWGMHAAGRPVMGGGQARGAHRWANYR